MTIRTNINAADLRGQLEKLDACAEHSPEGAYADVKAISALVRDTMDGLAAAMGGLGLKFDGGDAAEEVAAVLYGFVKHSNPEAYGLITGEGFGEIMLTGSDELKERVLRQSKANVDFFAGRAG